MTKRSMPRRIPDSATPMEPAPDLTGPAVDAWMHSGEAYAKACLAWQHEVFRFFGSRLQWDGQVSAALAKCRTLSELAEIQQDWAMAAAKDYVDEFNRLTQLAADFVPSWLPCAAPRPETPRARPVE